MKPANYTRIIEATNVLQLQLNQSWIMGMHCIRTENRILKKSRLQ